MLDFWFSKSEDESTEIRKEILEELKERGLREPLLFVGDGLLRLKDVIKKVYARVDFRRCIL